MDASEPGETGDQQIEAIFRPEEQHGGEERLMSLDPRADPEFEMYDLLEDPQEESNLLDRATGLARAARHDGERRRLARRLAQLCADVGALAPALPA